MGTSESAITTSAMSLGGFQFVFALANDSTQAPNGVRLTDNTGDTKYVSPSGELVSYTVVGDNKPAWGYVNITLLHVYPETQTQGVYDTTDDYVGTPAKLKKVAGRYHVTIAKNGGNARVHGAAISKDYIEGEGNEQHDVFETSETIDSYFRITDEGVPAYYNDGLTESATTNMKVSYSIAATETGSSVATEGSHEADKIAVASLEVVNS